MGFSTDWLMPSDKYNSIMATIIVWHRFSLRGAFWYTAVYTILLGLTSVLLWVPFIFADSERHWFGGKPVGFHCIMEIVVNFLSDYFYNRAAFRKVPDSYCCVMGWTYSWQRSVMDTSLFLMIIDGCGALTGVQQPLWLQMCFLISFWFVLLCNRLNIAVKDA